MKARFRVIEQDTKYTIILTIYSEQEWVAGKVGDWYHQYEEILAKYQDHGHRLDHRDQRSDPKREIQTWHKNAYHTPVERALNLDR